MIALLDYGAGNLRSVQKAFSLFGYEACITSDKKIIENASHICLPGVGAFKKGMEGLKENGLDKIIKNEIKKGKPFLGICLGMQMLFENSYEDGFCEGLSLLKGKVVKFDNGVKIPHIGWNDIDIIRKEPLFNGLNNCKMYFVHSYYVDTLKENISAVCEYSRPFAAAVQKDNIFATQFHPEKCGKEGLKILKNFGGLK